MDKEQSKESLPGYPSVQQFSADGFKRVVNGVKAFQALPQPGPSWDLYKSYPEFSRSMKNARSKIIPMMASLLKHVNIPTADFRSRDVDEKFEFLVEANDDLMERIGMSLDEAEGLFTKSEMVVVDKGLASTALKAPGSWGKRKLDSMEEGSVETKTKPHDISSRQKKTPIFRLRVTEKPQLKFSKPVDNSIAPFVPKLKEKPYSIKPLSILPEYNSKNEEFYGHPYLLELNKWEPRDDMLNEVNIQLPKTVKDTSLVYVSTLRDLERMMSDLLNKKDIAVDLEHHSFRTYLGLSCLIQISTRETDYVIDGISLRDDLWRLNEILTNPKVLKIFHGSNNDIEWLQRDFGLYVVNMFDTHIAAKALGLPQLSLQYLLGKYCDISQNKAMQLADWRIRPLPNEMLEYARQDTHYLIYIYERMRNELIEAGNQHNNLLLSVYDQSRLQCLKRYEKPLSNAQLALRKTTRSLNNRQLYAYTEIYKWRDEIAREKDESLGYVLPNHMLLTIAETLPKEMNGILACCDPVPPLLTSNIGKIHKIITTARELSLHQQSTQKDKVEKKAKLKNWVILVNSIHDLAPIDASESSTVNEFEEKEELSSKPVESSVWPESWNDPGSWKPLIKSKPSACHFSKKRIFKTQKVNHSQPSVGAVSFDRECISTPYGRYDASKKIIDMLKDPKAEENLDLRDPLVKAVYEAVTVVDDADKMKEEVEEAPRQELNRVLHEGDFIPFNPLAQTSTPGKRRRKHKKKGETMNTIESEDQLPSQMEEEVLGLPSAKTEGEIQQNDEGLRPKGASAQRPLLKASQGKRNRKKKGKLINRIKNVFSKHKPTSKSEEAVEIIELDEDQSKDFAPSISGSKESSHRNLDNISSPRAKRLKGDDTKELLRQQGHRDDRRGHMKSPNQPQDSKRNNRNKNKAGIFKAFKRNNKSITFK